MLSGCQASRFKRRGLGVGFPHSGRERFGCSHQPLGGGSNSALGHFGLVGSDSDPRKNRRPSREPFKPPGMADGDYGGALKVGTHV